MNGAYQAIVLDPIRVDRLGRLIIVAVFSILLLLLLLSAYLWPERLVFFPIALLASFVLTWLFRHPEVNLYIVLASFVTVIGQEEGLQVSEIFYGIYYLAFLATWFIDRLVVRRIPICHSWGDRALFVFLILITLSLPLTFLFDGSFQGYISNWTALSLLGFYFPVRELCRRDATSTRNILLILAWFGVFVAIRNGIEYRADLGAARYVYQIVRERVILNDGLLMLTSVISFIFLVHVERKLVRLGLLLVFAICFAGLILTLSRGFWAAFVLGIGVAFLFIDWKQRQRMLFAGTFGGLLLLGASMFFFGDLVRLVFSGLLHRFSSLGAGVISDPSIVSRLIESKGALAYVRENPIIGHGMGVPFRYFDVLTRTTVSRVFIHNGYLSLWYRFGIWGVFLILVFWGNAIYSGLQAFRLREASPLQRIAGLSCASVLVANITSALTSNPFVMGDTILIFGMAAAVAVGTYEHNFPSSDPGV